MPAKNTEHYESDCMKCGRDVGYSLYGRATTVLLRVRTTMLCPDCIIAFERWTETQPLISELIIKWRVAQKHFDVARDASAEQLEAWIRETDEATTDIAVLVDGWLAP